MDSESDDISDPKNLKIRITRSMQIAYEEAFKDLEEDIRSFCVSRGAEFFSVSCDKPFEKTLFGDLLKAGIVG